MIAKTKALVLLLTLILQHNAGPTRSGYYLPVEQPLIISQAVEPKINPKAVDCLATNLYYEAGNQSNTGMVAVAYVTMNRTHTYGFPHSICSVVHQKHQFSWTISHKKLKHNWSWHRAKLIAFNVYMRYNRKKDPTHGATYYHADYVKPVNWTGHDHVKFIKRIGNHIFYKKVRYAKY